MKYILHGGTAIGQREDAEFYKQMTGSFNNPKVLLVYFSREKEDWPKLAKNDTENFQAANPDATFTFTIASEEDFKGQLTENDIIYFAGGSTLKLMDTIKNMSVDLKKALDGKVLAGSSAGAHLIAKWHYGHTAKKVNPGLGLLDVAVFTHYRPAEGTYFWKPDGLVEEIEKELEKTGSKVYLLKEQASVVFDGYQ